MTRTLRIASVQMDVTPAPLEARLERAEKLVQEAASVGAQLVVLPELFNTGYVYDDSNYRNAEPMDGRTVIWMQETAASFKVHLIGTLLLLDHDDIYNSALLFAPDGKMWRYDKIYPWAFERAYYREGQGITVADTELGKLGIMICWDSAHPELWERYAGRVDAMLIPSCPPKMSSADLVFGDGTRINMRELGGVFDSVYTDREHFPEDWDGGAEWLGVPVAASVAAGKIRTYLPRPEITLATYLAGRPDLWDRVREAKEVSLETGFDQQTKIVDGAGRVVARFEEDRDGFVCAEVTLADEPPQPETKQPPMNTPPAAYFFCDLMAPTLLVQSYRAGVRRYLGASMAPVDPRTRLWTAALATTALVTGGVGYILGRGRS